MWLHGFIAQLVEHRTGIAEVTGSYPVEALIFFRLLFSNCLNWKFTAMIILHFDLQPQFKYMNYFIHTSRNNNSYFTLKTALTQAYVHALAEIQGSKFFLFLLLVLILAFELQQVKPKYRSGITQR